ncbi:WGR domain-containing protein [Mesorhizobium australicum]|uniref:WGR domain-containing protein n=1 Tax=Mesorhizobium australicum TaxID=536018 RepID=UPI00333B05BC
MEQLVLHRIDPARNMARFYALSVEPTLFGGTALIRNWGRIGTRGQAMMQTFDEGSQAAEALIRLERRKTRRGYAPPPR